MEFLWMIPLYILIPATGIIFVFIGLNSKNGHRGNGIRVGLLLLSLPVFHVFFVDQVNRRNGHSLIGKYALDSTVQLTLRLYPDNTFELANLDSVRSGGKGKWEYHRWDIGEVKLAFADSSELWFQVVNHDNRKYLENSFWTGRNHKYIKLIRKDTMD